MYDEGIVSITQPIFFYLKVLDQWLMGAIFEILDSTSLVWEGMRQRDGDFSLFVDSHRVFVC